MTKRMPWTLCGLAGLLVVGVAMAAGLAPGTAVPTLYMDAFNDDRGRFCPTCEAGLKPAMVAFVRHNDQATRKLLTSLDKAWRANQSKRLYAGVVVIDGDGANGLKKYVNDQKLKIPVAILPASDSEVKHWKLDSEVSRQGYFMVKHRIKRNAANLQAGQVAGFVKEIVPED